MNAPKRAIIFPSIFISNKVREVPAHQEFKKVLKYFD